MTFHDHTHGKVNQRPIVVTRDLAFAARQHPISCHRRQDPHSAGRSPKRKLVTLKFSSLLSIAETASPQAWCEPPSLLVDLFSFRSKPQMHHRDASLGRDKQTNSSPWSQLLRDVQEIDPVLGLIRCNKGKGRFSGRAGEQPSCVDALRMLLCSVALDKPRQVAV